MILGKADCMWRMLGIAVGIPLVGLFSLWQFYHIVRALRTGVANAAGVLHNRKRAPVWFYLTVFGQIFFSVIGVYTLLWLLMELLSR